MSNLDIIIPVMNEEGNLPLLVQRISQSMRLAEISYKMIFIDDHSSDNTVNELKNLQKTYPIEVYTKQGTPGKAYSIIEGVKYSTSENIAMIDADLQYPPEALPQMYELLKGSGVVIARRKVAHGSALRRFISRSFSTVFGKLLHGLNYDIQSGLKLFKKEVINNIDSSKITPWTLDLSLVITARDLGLGISEVDIEFAKRTNGDSKINIFKASYEIGKNAVKLKFLRKKLFYIKPHKLDSMAGSGVIHKQKRYITHTTLPEKHLALKTFTNWQKLTFAAVLIAVIAGLLLNPITTIAGVIAVLSVIYFADVVFNVGVILKSLHYPPEITIPDQDINLLKDSDLPIYTILCPLYREAEVLPHFLESIEKLNWPKDKLDVILLLEEDDEETVKEISRQKLPFYVRILVTPDSQPKTKPKACNYGLAHANGEFLVIYDAEDRPEPDQLKKAFLGFKTAGEKVVCLQAKLNYFNPHQNLLTKFFTAEYSLWFDVMLPGLQSINTVIPLGGTSNHFRIKTLKDLQGWDPFNVTEDCDLGVRIFKKGLLTAIIDSVTLEEANSNWGNWVRQRSRWLKGYMQTYLVHMRNPFEFIKQNGWHAFIFQLIVGARISFMLINPILWLTTISYFAFYAYVGPAIEELFPTTVFYMAVFSLVVGNFTYIYNYMIGALKRDHHSVVKFVYLIPLYWLVASYAAAVAAYQLIVKPHYWEKTVHGLHLSKAKVEKTVEKVVDVVEEVVEKQITPAAAIGIAGIPWYKKLGSSLSKSRVVFASSFLVAATFITGVLNLGFSIYLGRVVTFEDLAKVSLVSSFLFFAGVPQISLFNTVTNKIGFLEGRKQGLLAQAFLYTASKKSIIVSIILSALWLALIPILMGYFNTNDIFPFLLFTPVWVFNTGFALVKGLLAGKIKLEKLGALLIFEAFAKFAATLILLQFGYHNLVYAGIPLSIVLSLIFALFIVNKDLKVLAPAIKKKEFAFPYKFFFASSLSVLAPVAFLSLDVLLANHYLPSQEAGKYALISTVGKIIYFVGSLSNQLVLPFVSRNEGASKNSENILLYVFIATFVITGAGFLFWGKFASLTGPFFFGEKALTIVPYLEPYTFAMMLFTISQIFVSYYLAKKIYTFPVASFLLVILQYFLISLNHANLEAIVMNMFIVGLLNLCLMTILHYFAEQVRSLESNLNDLFGLLSRSLPFEPQDNKKLRILIFNWRDVQHVWAGGAENYLHELAKLWVKDGYQVTVFCGNDSKNPRYETIDGVQIVRRGGFFTVYFWAPLYYIFRFRGLYDLVIDSENGIPFFTPIYVRKSKLLLIHHIHQEVFRNHLPLPLAMFASFLEGKLMPFVYKNQKVITVSESSKQEILKLGKDIFGSIEIVNPGIHNDKFLNLKKTKHPSFLYLGRLQPYKNIDVAVKAFARVVQKHSDAVLTIAGFGESMITLKKLVADLKIEKSVIFSGRVSEEKKHQLLSENWVMVQPSMIEGWGITVIEANASGTPVIASNVNGLRDSVVDGKTGMLIKPKDVDMFAKVMMDLVENKEFREFLSVQAIKWSQNFSWINSASKFLSVINDDISSKVLKKIELKGLSLEV